MTEKFEIRVVTISEKFIIYDRFKNWNISTTLAKYFK